ncbi:WD40-repeat-containing domain protein [Schizophyllum amplum]|uniref:WD repeat-containing protein JIP5 n=1 Tax=Schizophyllum amplum TaxID=97359 RepID=A0A550CPU2_9AGAR|nr:WD40-repeat-containing domain protein [Auriculariopsis ampla]
MPFITVGSQIFDLVFHPKHPTVYTALLSGHVKAYTYDAQGNIASSSASSESPAPAFSIRTSKRSCRGLAITKDGAKLYAAGKGKGLHTIDTLTGKVSDTRAGAHESAINRVKCLTSWLLSTGDDDGVIKLWDPRQRDATRTYTQHFDYITDFLWLEDKKHLIATSGDGSLSVMDVRAKTTKPIAHSEDQEDELLSIVMIGGGTKAVVGTQLGVLSIFNRISGWGDCVDRVPGHPQSIDALCNLPDLSSLNVDTSRTVLTGSSDGFVRAVQVLPTKLLGVVADHGEWPVERVAVGEGPVEGDDAGAETFSTNVGNNASGGKAKDEEEDEQPASGRYWVGSVGHDEVLRLTNLEAFFREEEEAEEEEAEEEEAEHDGDEKEEEEEEEWSGVAKDADEDASDADEGGGEEDEAAIAKGKDANGKEETTVKAKKSEVKDDSDDSDDSGSDSDAPQEKKRKRKQGKDVLVVKKKKGRNEVEIEGKFFDEL